MSISYFNQLLKINVKESSIRNLECSKKEAYP